MKFSYMFSNLLGTVYQRGDIIFAADGNTVVCPVGNKISLHDLSNNKSKTLPVEARWNYTSLALSPNGRILLAAQEDGELHMISINHKSIIYKKRLNATINHIKFSPDGKHFAVTKHNSVHVYNTPSCSRRVYDPFALEAAFYHAIDDSTCIDWSFDSRLLAFGSRDMSVYVCAFAKLKELKVVKTIGTRDTVVGVFFDAFSYDLCTVNKNGCISLWDCNMDPDEMTPLEDIYKKKTKTPGDDDNDDVDDEDENVSSSDDEMEEEVPKSVAAKKKALMEANAEKKINKAYFNRRLQLYQTQHLKGKKCVATSASYRKENHMLITGFSLGDFILMDLTDNGQMIHSLNISNQAVTSVAFNPTGDWIAAGVSALGQLLVWEWQSETHVLKQQGHFNNMRVTAYSPDGLNIATGGEDGKVKLWSTLSSFCFITFSEHQAAVTGVVFTQSGKAVISSSLDGTVRAFDLVRYRNFKTLTSPTPAQFSCLSVDSSGELVVAGGQDVHDIFLWSLQTGRLLEILAGHSGPVASVQFSQQPGSTKLVSTAWDNTVKVWDAISNTTAKETISILSIGLYVAIRPDGEQLAVATLDGQITMFNTSTCQQEANIEGRNDLGSGKGDADKITAKSNLKAKSFTCLSYSSDGQYILAAGNSKNVCIYSIADELLIKKFEITQNRSFDAMDEILNRRKMAENDVNLALVEERMEGEISSIKVPGTVRGDMSKRAFRPEVRVMALTFSPTGRSWAAATTEGLLVYSLEDDWLFDPLDLDEGNTPEAVKKKLSKKEFSVALMMASRLNIKILIQEALESIPVESISVVVGSLPQLYVESILKFLGNILETTKHVGLYAHWISSIVKEHGQAIKLRSPHIMSILNDLQKSLSTHYNNLGKVCSHNEYMLKYLLTQSILRKNRLTKQLITKVEQPISQIEDETNDQTFDFEENFECDVNIS